MDYGPAEDVYEMVNNGLLRFEVTAIEEILTHV